MTTTDVVVLIAILAVGTCIVGFMLRDWLGKRRRIKALAARLQYDDDADFGRRFFPDAKRAEIAARVRRVLSKNLEMPLGGLTPSDRLDDDLNAELACNPHLFWDLDAEFDIKTSDTLEAFENAVKRVVTFQDLVDFVEGGVSIMVATRDAAYAPECVRAVGATVSSDRQLITLLLNEAR